jgi:hypothetical protein
VLFFYYVSDTRQINIEVKNVMSELMSFLYQYFSFCIHEGVAYSFETRKIINVSLQIQNVTMMKDGRICFGAACGTSYKLSTWVPVTLRGCQNINSNVIIIISQKA